MDAPIPAEKRAGQNTTALLFLHARVYLPDFGWREKGRVKAWYQVFAEPCISSWKEAISEQVHL